MLKINEKYCSWNEVYFFEQNEHSVYKATLEHRDNGDCFIRLEDVNGADVSHQVYGDKFKSVFQAIQEENKHGH